MQRDDKGSPPRACEKKLLAHSGQSSDARGGTDARAYTCISITHLHEGGHAQAQATSGPQRAEADDARVIGRRSFNVLADRPSPPPLNVE